MKKNIEINKTAILFLMFLLMNIDAQNDVVRYSTKELTDEVFIKDFMLIGPFPNPLPKGETNYFHTDVCVGFKTDYLKSAGEFDVLIGNSARNILLKDTFNIQ